MLEMLVGMVKEFPKDISLGRMFESILLLFLIWSKLKPHLKKIEDRLEGLEKAVGDRFNSGEERFTKIEARIQQLEITKKGEKYERPIQV